MGPRLRKTKQATKPAQHAAPTNVSAAETTSAPPKHAAAAAAVQPAAVIGTDATADAAAPLPSLTAHATPEETAALVGPRAPTAQAAATLAKQVAQTPVARRGGRPPTTKPSAGPATPTQKGAVHFTKDDYLLIVRWLEVKANRELITGTSKAAAPGKAVPKTRGYERLADFVAQHSKTPGLAWLEAKNMAKRYSSYMSNYRKTKTLADRQTGEGLVYRLRSTAAYCSQVSRITGLSASPSAPVFNSNSSPAKLSVSTSVSGCCP